MRYVEETGDIPIAPGTFPGHLLITFICPECRNHFTGIAAIGTVGATCPACDYYLPVNWIPDERSDPKHDGTWLTGEWNLPFFDEYDDEEDDEESEYDMRLAPLLARCIAFCKVVWFTAAELFGRKKQ